jgi:prepilin-type N-terminal cleavage/methylation domain-containing protein
MIKDFKKRNTKKGFTMIETLVAIFILLISTTGPLSFAQSGLRASFLARDQIVAFYLSQDVIETIKNLRDNNSLSGADWLALDGGALSSLDQCTTGGRGCRMETGSNFTIEQCSSTPCEPMYYNDTTKEFVLDDTAATTPSKYTRTFYVDELEDDREIQIIVVVEWDSNFFSERKIVIQENIYNWLPAYTN